MREKIVILDDALETADLLWFLEHDFTKYPRYSTEHWIEGVWEIDALRNMLEVCEPHFAVQDVLGVEIAKNTHTSLREHYDQDEYLAERGKRVWPLFSIAYYPHVNVKSGGELQIHGMLIPPKTNRMILFSPGMLHKVNAFEGERISIGVNPWEWTPKGYEDLQGIRS